MARPSATRRRVLRASLLGLSGLVGASTASGALSLSGETTTPTPSGDTPLGNGTGNATATDRARVFVHPVAGEHAGAAKAVRKRNGAVVHRYASHDFFAVELPMSAVEAVASHPAVSHVSKDKVATTDATTDPTERPSWGFDHINTGPVHSRGITGQGVSVGVLDTGVGKVHDDLQKNVAGGTNCTSSDESDWWDRHGHGTHCAGIATAVDNDEGVVGVAKAADLYGVKVLHDDGTGYYSDIIAGIEWCRSNGVAVLSMSLGGGPSAELKAAVDGAAADGHLVVAAAGNDGNDEDGTCEEGNVSFPGGYESVVCVGAVEQDGSLAPYSAVGDAVDLLAPGSGIYSTDKLQTYSTKTGTSMATPHVAGAAALVWQSVGFDGPDPAAREQVRRRLESGARPVDGTCQDGYGLVHPVTSLHHNYNTRG